MQKPKFDVPIDNLQRLAKLLDPHLSPTWVPQLLNIFEQAGLRETLCDRRNPLSYWFMAYHECNIATYNQFAYTTKHESFVNQLRELLPLIAEDMRKGVCWAFAM